MKLVECISKRLFIRTNDGAGYDVVIEGDIMFHSVIYGSKNTNSLRSGTVRQLGSKASHGCVRLAVENAKWIYDNCTAGTPVTVE